MQCRCRKILCALQAQLRRQIKEERERHTRQVAQLEAKIIKLSSESDRNLQQQLDECQQEYDQKLQDIKVWPKLHLRHL